MSVQSVAIIGAGPAGLAAAIQLNRYGIRPLLLEGGEVGGLLRNANLVENYPGFPQGSSGRELARLFALQAENANVEVTCEEVLELSYQGLLFHIETTAKSYLSRLVVVASGTRPVTFDEGFIPQEASQRVFYEVYPLLGYAGKRIGIIGAGDAAFDYALNLARSNQVFILNRGEQLKCLPLLWERASRTPQITYYPMTRLIEVLARPHIGLQLECLGATGELSLQVDVLIGALGRAPRLDFLSESLQSQAQLLEEQGVLYFIGDVKHGIFRQTAIAVGDGILTAMKIYQRLEETKQ